MDSWLDEGIAVDHNALFIWNEIRELKTEHTATHMSKYNQEIIDENKVFYPRFIFGTYGYIFVDAQSELVRAVVWIGLPTSVGHFIQEIGWYRN